MKSPKVIVIGLDGGTWSLLRPWADNGDLPTFKRLLGEGVNGMLQTIIPPITAPAWASFATGKNPGKHGIFDFIKMEGNNVRMISTEDLRSDTFYDMLSREGFRNIIVGLPLSFPPKKDFNGIIISDFLYPRKEIEPKEKSQYLDGYRVWPYYRAWKSREELLDAVERTAINRIRTTKKLIVNESWDFFFLHYGETDWISHRLWVDVRNNTKLSRKAKHIFVIADQFLDWLLRWMDEKCYLFVISDHGFGDCPIKINLNRIFIRERLLKVCPKKTLGFKSVYSNLYGRGKTRLPKFILRFLNYVETNNYNLYRKIFEVLLIGKALLLFGKARSRYETGIDFENSKVFKPNDESFGIYINEPTLEKREKIIKEVIGVLEHAQHKGNKVFKRVLRREEIYSGAYINEAPDIMSIPNGFFISKTLDGPLFEKYADGCQHDFNGIFLAYGPDIRKGIEMKNVGICDIAPTILHIFGLPIPDDMDGRVLAEIFEDHSELKKRTLIYVRPTRYNKVVKQRLEFREEEKIKDRLRVLGYL